MLLGIKKVKVLFLPLPQTQKTYKQTFEQELRQINVHKQTIHRHLNKSTDILLYTNKQYTDIPTKAQTQTDRKLNSGSSVDLRSGHSIQRFRSKIFLTFSLKGFRTNDLKVWCIPFVSLFLFSRPCLLLLNVLLNGPIPASLCWIYFSFCIPIRMANI